MLGTGKREEAKLNKPNERIESDLSNTLHRLVSYDTIPDVPDPLLKLKMPCGHGCCLTLLLSYCRRCTMHERRAAASAAHTAVYRTGILGAMVPGTWYASSAAYPGKLLDENGDYQYHIQ